MKIIGFLIILLVAVSNAYKFNTKAFVNSFGYPLLEYQLKTSDGYRLTLQRISHGPNNETSTNREVVFLMHGLLGSSENWLILGPPKSLAFYLVDRGYDVWMGNARGNTHSKQHATLSPDQREFWDFSWHEIGVYDLPAMIDFAIDKTGQSQIFYVGHSQGTTTFFVMGAERPDYMNKIKLFTALAPVAFLTHMTHPIAQTLANFDTILDISTDIIGVKEVVPNNDLLNLLGAELCKLHSLVTELCANILFLLGGYNSIELDRKLVPLIIATSPAGSSVKQFAHYGQLIKTDLISTGCKLIRFVPLIGGLCNVEYGLFKQFDYGASENYRRYGQESPPLYNLKNVIAPTILMFSNNDDLVSIKDAQHLAEVLPNVVANYLVPLDEFTHIDFIFAKDADQLVYDIVYHYLQQF